MADHRDFDFRLGITPDVRAVADALGPNGDLTAPADALGVAWDYLAPDDPVSAAAAGSYDALLVLGHRIDHTTLEGRRLALVARLGVGTDKVDVDACTEAGVLVTVTRRA